MKKIYFQNGILIFYGNPVGYRQDGKVIVDSIFYREELLRYINEQEKAEVEVREGVYDRLAEGGDIPAGTMNHEEKRLRIYQLKQETPIMMRFVGLAERRKRGYGMPQRKEYVPVYEGEIDKFDLEEVWEKFGRRVPEGLTGRTLAISDVIEFYDGKSSRFFYVQPDSYTEISFEV